jgi:hypothetical protein
MGLEENVRNLEWGMQTRLAFQVKLCEMMSGGDLEKWGERYGKIFHDILEEDTPEGETSLKDRVYQELEANWNAPSSKESPLLREIADELQSRYDMGNQAESDEETFERAA